MPIALHTRGSDVAGGARIKAVQLADGTATAVVTAPGGVESDVELRKVAGQWLIADF